MVLSVKTTKNFRSVGHQTIDIRNIDGQKIKLFNNIFKNYFVNVVWSRKDASNPVLKTLGPALYKFFDIVANVAKMYCYNPTERHKEDMKKGIVGLTPHQERPELRNG